MPEIFTWRIGNIRLSKRQKTNFNSIVLDLQLKKKKFFQILPSWTCDDHFCSKFVEFVPQSFGFDNHFDVEQLRMKRFSWFIHILNEIFTIELIYSRVRFNIFGSWLNVIWREKWQKIKSIKRIRIELFYLPSFEIFSVVDVFF